MRIIATGFQLPMKIFRLLILLWPIPAFVLAETPAQVSLSEAQQKLRGRARDQGSDLGKKNAAACAEADGWLFFAAEFRLLSLGRFWGDEAPKVSRSHKPELADPIPAIVDFQEQLKARGIDLLVVPVPPKAAIYPEKILSGFDVRTDDAAPVLHRFYEELRAAGIEVIDLMPLMIQNDDENRCPVFCKTDSHWSGTRMRAGGASDRGENRTEAHRSTAAKGISSPSGKRFRSLATSLTCFPPMHQNRDRKKSRCGG